MRAFVTLAVGLGVIAFPPTVAADTCDHVRDLALRAASDDPVAQYDLGVEYFRGRCIAKDLARAAALWRKVTATGDLSAHNNLGYLTLHGLGVPRDEREGVRLLRYAAERGQPESQLHLAYAYWKGRGVAHDPVRAWAWTRTSISSAGRLSPPDPDAEARTLLAEIEPMLSSRDRRKGDELALKLIARHSPRPK